MRILRSKIKNQNVLKKTIQQIQKKGGKIVFTNGCFDLLHPGHVTYLEKARKLGSHLIVALNSDASVRRLKGVGRPINSLAARMTVLSSLEAVDFVTWFEDETPLRLINMLKPQVLVKGGDYKVQTVVGSKEARSWDGKTVIIPFLNGFSTTGILKKTEKKK